MWPFKKKTIPYTRPTGLRARPSWQIFWAIRQHPLIVWGMRFAAFYSILFLVGIGFMIRNDIWEGGGEQTPAFVSQFVVIIAMLLLAPFLVQLAHAKRLAISMAVPEILRRFAITYLSLGVVCFFLWSHVSWISAFFGFGIFLIATGIPLLFSSFGLSRSALLSGFLSYGGTILFTGIMADNAVPGFNREWFVVLTPGLLAVTILVLVMGIAIWFVSWYRLRCCWCPTDEQLSVSAIELSPRLLRSVHRQQKEDRFARWFARERERRFEELRGVSPRTIREQIQFFRRTSRPSRVGPTTIAIVLGLLPVFWVLSDDFMLNATIVLIVGLIVIGMQAAIMVGEWRKLFAVEALFPISRKRYLLVAIISRFQNLLLGLVPLLVLVPWFVLLNLTHLNSFENLDAFLVVFAMFLIIFPSLFLMAIYLPNYALLTCFFLLEIFFVFRVFGNLPNEKFVSIPDLGVLTLLAAVTIPISLWRLYHIEPDRVGRT